MKHYAIILASGSGSRCGLDIPKQFYKINGKTILEYSINTFNNHKGINSIIVVTNPNFFDLTCKIISKNNYSKVIKILPGGLERQQSSFIGISAIEDKNAKVLIHDAARPFVSVEIITNCIKALKTHNAINTAVNSSDTIIEVDDNNFIKNVPERKFLRRCQTPQGFDLNIIKKAHVLAEKDMNYSASDDCGLILKYKLSDVYVIQGSEYNIKITSPVDIQIAKKILELNK